MINPLHPNISMYILHTVLYAFPKLTGGICSIIKIFFSWWSLILFLWPKCVIQRWYCEDKLEARPSKGSKSQDMYYWSEVDWHFVFRSCYVLLVLHLKDITFLLDPKVVLKLEASQKCLGNSVLEKHNCVTQWP